MMEYSQYLMILLAPDCLAGTYFILESVVWIQTQVIIKTRRTMISKFLVQSAPSNLIPARLLVSMLPLDIMSIPTPQFLRRPALLEVNSHFQRRLNVWVLIRGTTHHQEPPAKFHVSLEHSNLNQIKVHATE